MRISPSIDVERLLAGGYNPGRNSQRIRLAAGHEGPAPQLKSIATAISSAKTKYASKHLPRVTQQMLASCWRWENKNINCLMSLLLRGRARAALLPLLALLFANGCANLPPLDDATEMEVVLASENDIAEYNRTNNEFLPAVEGYLPSSELRLTDRFPTLKISFATTMQLVGLNDHHHVVMLDFCDGGDQDPLVGSSSYIMWQRQILSPENAPNVSARLARGQRQRYVLLARYWYTGPDPDKRENRPVLPAPNDLCISFGEILMIAPTRRGKPLRIDKNVVNRVIAPFLEEQSSRTQ